MSMYELNKIIGAALFTVLVVMGLRTFAGIIYSSPLPDKPGYKIEVAEGGTEEKTAAKSEQAEAVPLARLLASASADKGRKIAKKCGACHTFNDGGAKKVGPNLFGIVGRKLAQADGFAYSDAFRKKASEVSDWSYEALNAFIASPKTFIPGTKMSFAGLKKATSRADLIVYLRTLGGNPPPLPASE